MSAEREADAARAAAEADLLDRAVRWLGGTRADPAPLAVKTVGAEARPGAAARARWKREAKLHWRRNHSSILRP